MCHTELPAKYRLGTNSQQSTNITRCQTGLLLYDISIIRLYWGKLSVSAVPLMSQAPRSDAAGTRSKGATAQLCGKGHASPSAVRMAAPFVADRGVSRRPGRRVHAGAVCARRRHRPALVLPAAQFAVQMRLRGTVFVAPSATPANRRGPPMRRKCRSWVVPLCNSYVMRVHQCDSVQISGRLSASLSTPSRKPTPAAMPMARHGLCRT